MARDHTAPQQLRMDQNQRRKLTVLLVDRVCEYNPAKGDSGDSVRLRYVPLITIAGGLNTQGYHTDIKVTDDAFSFGAFDEILLSEAPKLRAALDKFTEWSGIAIKEQPAPFTKEIARIQGKKWNIAPGRAWATPKEIILGFSWRQLPLGDYHAILDSDADLGGWQAGLVLFRDEVLSEVIPEMRASLFRQREAFKGRAKGDAEKVDRLFK